MEVVLHVLHAAGTIERGREVGRRSSRGEGAVRQRNGSSKNAVLRGGGSSRERGLLGRRWWLGLRRHGSGGWLGWFRWFLFLWLCVVLFSFFYVCNCV
ncbi:hypothetical protein SESBI_10728 [Sesbania bispinosa]|nr:hypothetical protein SESBI_10728 [Sesbania bispinosa]